MGWATCFRLRTGNVGKYRNELNISCLFNEPKVIFMAEVVVFERFVNLEGRITERDGVREKQIIQPLDCFPKGQGIWGRDKLNPGTRDSSTATLNTFKKGKTLPRSLSDHNGRVKSDHTASLTTTE